MSRHLKIIGFSVGLLLVLSALANPSIALAAFQ